ncbi:MAG: FlgD immunoglobulin-like domain containing protein [Bacteroidota bacterium]
MKKTIAVLLVMAAFELVYTQNIMNGMTSLIAEVGAVETSDVLGQITKANNNVESTLQQCWILPHSYTQSQSRRLGTLYDWVMMDTAFSSVPPEDAQQTPEIAYGSSNYLIVWQDNRAGDFYNYDYDVYAARVSTDGELLDPYGIKIAAKTGILEKEPSVAFDGTNFLVIWSEDRDAPLDYNIYGARISSDGEVLDPDGFQICAATNPQTLTGISFNGTHYLAAWSDYRSGNYDIYGARIDPDGTVLEPDGFAIFSAPDNQAYPSVASDGSAWLLSWGAIGESVIIGTRVGADGSVLDPDGFTISTGMNNRCWPDIDYDGTNYMVVWMDKRSGTNVTDWGIYGSRVTTDGTVLDPDGIPIAADNNIYEGIPELCFGETNYLVVWKDDGFGEMTGVLVSPDGVIQGADRFPISGAVGNELYHALGHDGSNWLVTWEDYRSINSVSPGFGSDIYSARVDETGNVLDVYPNDIAVSMTNNFQFCPAADNNGNEHLLIWQEKVAVDQYDIKGTRVATDGIPIDSPTLSICSETDDQGEPVIAFGNTVYFAVWRDFRSSTMGNIYGARISEDGTVLDQGGFMITTGTNGERMPAVAFDGTNFLIIWWVYVGSQYHVYGARISEEGTILDPGGFDIATVSTDYGWNNFVDLSVAFNGENYLVVWPEFVDNSWDIYGARVTPDGVVLDEGGFAVSSDTDVQYFPNVTSSGGQSFVVWTDLRNNNNDIYSARVDADGNVLDPDGIALCVDGGGQTMAHADFDGSYYVVIWADWRNGNPDVYGTVVDLDGHVMDPDGVVFVSNPEFDEYPTISAGSNGEAMVFYSGYEPQTYSSTRVWGGVYTNPYVGIDDPDQQGAKSSLLSNVPNPFNSSTKVIFDLSTTGYVQMEVYDFTGRHVSTLQNGILSAGHHEIVWNACDENGGNLDSGIYLCHFSSDGHEEILKMILLK